MGRRWRLSKIIIFSILWGRLPLLILICPTVFLPIKTYQNLETDPLNFIANAMSKLEFHGEGCAVQVLIKPNQSWQDDAKKIIWEMKSGKSFREAYSMVKKNIFEHIVASMNSKKNEEEDKKNKPVMAIDEPTIKAMEQKASKIGFDANIRLIASALTQTRAEAILGGLENAFSQFENPNLNGFTIKRVAGKQLQKLLYNFSFRHFNNQQTMTLNTEELTSIFTFRLLILKQKYQITESQERSNAFLTRGRHYCRQKCLSRRGTTRKNHQR